MISGYDLKYTLSKYFFNFLIFYLSLQKQPYLAITSTSNAFFLSLNKSSDQSMKTACSYDNLR